MSKPDGELSSDLEWMLESGQATGEMLVEALASEFYVPVYRLALAIFGQPDLAHETASETFGQAWLSVYRFRQLGSVQNWLFSVALDTFRSARMRVSSDRSSPDLSLNPARGLPVPQSEFDKLIWQAVDQLPERTRLPVLFHFLLGWQEAEIARLMRTSLNFIHWQVVLARKQFLAAAWEAGKRQGGIDEYELDRQVAASLQARWPAPDLTPHQLDTLVARAWQHALQGQVRQKKALSIKEGLWIASAILLVTAMLWGANRLLPDEPEVISQPPRITQINVKQITREPKVVVATPEPEPEPAPRQRNDRPKIEVYVVQPGDTLSSIADSLGMLREDLRQLNELAIGVDLFPGQVLLVAPEEELKLDADPTPVTPAPQPEPLTRFSGSEEILTRLVESNNFWNTLWLDATGLDYGPLNYFGPPKGSHIQAWVDPSGTNLMLEGAIGGRADRAVAVYNWRTFVFDLNSGDMDEIQPPVVMDNLHLKEMVFARTSRWANGSGEFRPLLETEMNGRNMIWVDWISSQGLREATLAIDALTGVILDATWVDTNGYERYHFWLNQVFFDVDFPPKPSYFDILGTRDFATDYSGRQTIDPLDQPAPPLPEGRRRLVKNTPAPGFDPAGEDLFFQYASDYSTRAGQALVDLFAGSVYLGQVPFGNPWSLICERSPDGMRLAFASNPESLTTVGSRLHSFSLVDLQVVEAPLGRISNLAFAPDSRRLAVAGTRVNSTQRGVFVWDPVNQELDLVLPVLDARSLVWSPDGTELAMIANVTALGEDEVLVVDVRTGNVAYRDPVDMDSGSDKADWPMLEWGVNFPVEAKGMEACGLSDQP